MTLFFAPPMYYSAQTAWPCAPPMHYRRRGCAPCSPSGCNPFFLVALFVLLPTLLRLAAFVFVHLLPVLSLVMITKLAVCACSELSDDDARAGVDANSAWCGMPTKKSRPEESKESETVREALAKDAKPRRDWSSMKVERAPTAHDAVRIVIAAPGVKAEDLSVSISGDGCLKIEGETAAGGEVYSIERSLSAPRGVELEAATCTHADGLLTITVPRKPSKSIPVTNVPVVPTAVESSPTASATEVGAATEQPHRAAAETKADSDADEWVEMPAK